MESGAHLVTDDNSIPFDVTKAAREQIRALGGRLYIGTEPGGCCGTSYVFSAGSRAACSDLDEFDADDAVVVMEPETTQLLSGAKLDYSGRIRPPRFRVLKNPNTQDVCPCKRSFGKPWPGSGERACRAYVPMEWDEEYDPPHHWQRQTGWHRGQ